MHSESEYNLNSEYIILLVNTLTKTAQSVSTKCQFKRCSQTNKTTFGESRV